MENALIEAVCVVHEVRSGYFHDTAIDKRPVSGPVEIKKQGLVGDQQLDRTHGGLDKAVYVYASEDAEWWSAELGVPIPPGTFGDNVRTRGLDVTSALIGECWRIGDVVLQVRMPRTPCHNLSLRMGIEGFHVRFNSSGRVGALLKVLEPGTIETGAEVEVLDRPQHDVTVSLLAGGAGADQMRRLLDSGVPLADSVRAKARRIVSRAKL